MPLAGRRTYIQPPVQAGIPAGRASPARIPLTGEADRRKPPSVGRPPDYNALARTGGDRRHWKFWLIFSNRSTWQCRNSIPNPISQAAANEKKPARRFASGRGGLPDEAWGVVLLSCRSSSVTVRLNLPNELPHLYLVEPNLQERPSHLKLCLLNLPLTLLLALSLFLPL